LFHGGSKNITKKHTCLTLCFSQNVVLNGHRSRDTQIPIPMLLFIGNTFHYIFKFLRTGAFYCIFIYYFVWDIIDISTDIILWTKIPYKVDIEDDVTRTGPHRGEGLDHILKHSINYNIKG
jgi:hypothetical protein